jgi:hypothetical protein
VQHAKGRGCGKFHQRRRPFAVAPWSKEAAWAHRDHDPKSNPKVAILGCSSRRRDGLRAPRKWCLAWEKGVDNGAAD